MPLYFMVMQCPSTMRLVPLCEKFNKRCMCTRRACSMLLCSKPFASCAPVLYGDAGPQYRVLGALVWGPLCSMLHVLNDATQPKHLLEDLLVSEGLLSPLVTGGNAGGQGGRVVEQQSSVILEQSLFLGGGLLVYMLEGYLGLGVVGGLVKRACTKYHMCSYTGQHCNCTLILS